MPEGNGITSALVFDYGLRQIGIATGNKLSGATPRGILRARDGQPDWETVRQLIDEWRPDIVLVGLPLNMDGTGSELSARARKFARRLHGRFGVAVKMVDERLSTREAKSRVGPRDSYREDPIDDLAAQIILEGWLTDPSIAVDP